VKKIVWLFFIFTVIVLHAQEAVVVSYAPSKAQLRTLKHHLKIELKDDLERYGVSLRTLQLKDRYLLAVTGIKSPKVREYFLKLFATRFDDPFYIELPQKKVSYQQTNKESEPFKNRFEWVATLLLFVVLLYFFIRGLKEMFRVRRSQRLLRHEQMRIENELRKEL